MLNDLVGILEAHGPLTYVEAGRLLQLRQDMGAFYIARRIKQAILDDPRFVVGARDIRLSHLQPDDHLDSEDYVVLDIETTGSKVPEGALLEFAALRLRGNKILDRFELLINPERSIPPYVQKITGISKSMVSAQPTVVEALPMILDYIGDRVVIAHNAPFDVGFLSMSAQFHLGRPLENFAICTVKMAQWLLPDVKRCGLDDLTKLLNIDIEDRHRAMGDAEATAEIWNHMMTFLKARGVERMRDLRHVPNLVKQSVRRIQSEFDLERVKDMPNKPGVYFFADGDGETVYIGKSNQVRKRVRSYFNSADSQPPKVKRMLSEVREVDYQPAGSALEAEIVEAELIQQFRPRFNVKGKQVANYAFIEMTLGDRFPRLRLSKALKSSKSVFYGPFRGSDWTDSLVTALSRLFQIRSCHEAIPGDPSYTPCMAYEMGTCTAPCNATVTPTEYREQIEACLAFLEGDGSIIDHVAMGLDQGLKRFSEQHVQDRRDEIRLLRGYQEIAQRFRALHALNHVIVLPGVGELERLLMIVQGGNLIARQAFDLSTSVGESILSWIKANVREDFQTSLFPLEGAGKRREQVIPKEKIDVAYAIARFAADERNSDVLVPLGDLSIRGLEHALMHAGSIVKT